EKSCKYYKTNIYVLDTVDIDEKCPFGWTNFGVQCYKFFSQSANWITAERGCLSLDANLASVHSKPEHDFLLSLLPSSSTRCWLGVHDGIQEGQWLWSDGTPYDYTSWCSNEPNNLNTENCGEINWSCKNAVWFLLSMIIYNSIISYQQVKKKKPNFLTPL
uniref:C-type lectin domain-containing protein n=1 Tax=Cyprinus carpio TaxID=7962 RepID=A0A8C2B7Y9_CYPCA